MPSLFATLLLALAPGPAPARPAEEIPVLIVTGENNHWWFWTTSSLFRMLTDSGKFKVEITRDPSLTLSQPDVIAKYRAFVLDYNGPRWSGAAEETFLEAVRTGTGVVVVHAANNAFPGWKEYEEMVALCWRDGTGHGRFHAFDVDVVDRDHPITRDLPDLIAHPDELYHGLVHMHDTDYRVLATAHSSKESGGSGRDEPMAIVKEYGRGRIFHTPLGHVWPNAEEQKISHVDPQFQELVIRGTEWAATGEVTPTRYQPNTLSYPETYFGWELLFDGATSEGWRGYRAEGFPDGWSIENGTLRCVGGAGGGDLVTEREFRDFELAFEWRVSQGGNSGVIYRVSEDFDTTWQTGPEYQVLDDAAHPDADSRTLGSSLYGLYAPTEHRVRPAGEWNEGRILVVGNHVEHWLNGVRVLSCELGSDDWNERVAASKFAEMPGFARNASGRIALQDHGNDVWYRTIRVRDLAFDPEKARTLFDGESLAGWTPFLPDGSDPALVWGVGEDGALVCRGEPVGYLKTADSFDNFVLRLRWRFPPEAGGNSGVLLRQIGPDQVWPRSIEAQLQSGAAGDFWNIGEFPMTVDAARTNGRNTRRTSTNEKPLGEWNEYEITAWHGHVVLRVNGEILNQASGCMEVAGPICLQSEGAEIHFDELALTPLR